MSHSVEYDTYIRSAEWRALCQRIYKQRGRVCQRCGRDDRPLQIHHLTYDHLGCEREYELQIVCKDECHPAADKERVDREARRIAQRGMRWATLEEVERLTMKIISRQTI